MGLDLTGFGSIADLASNIIGRFFPAKMDEADRAKIQLELQTMLAKREDALIDAQRSIIVSEMEQGDVFTKRARPSIVYGGLAFIFLVHVLFPILAFFTKQSVPTLTLPTEFWWAWGGVCSVWVVGRSAEKRGASGNLLSRITGSK